MVSRSAFLDSSGEWESSRVTFTVDPEAARRVRVDVAGVVGLISDVRDARALVDRRAGIVLQCVVAVAGQ